MQDSEQDLMNCLVVSEYGEPHDIIKFVSDYPKPKLEPGSNKILVRVLACSTSPGDYRTMTGSVDVFRNPKRPYIPSQDICGIIEEIDGESSFKRGDCIIGTWDIGAYGGMAEYCLIDKKLAALKPSNINPIQGAAIANSSVNAMLAMEYAKIKKGDRILVLGGSSAVGTTLIQLARNIGVSFIASTSTDLSLLESLGVDQAIDYRETKFWEIEEFQKQPFDAIIDCAFGYNGWHQAKKKKILKTGWNGGIYLGITPDNPVFEIHTFCQFLKVFGPVMIGRPIWTKCCSYFVPKYKMHFGAPRGNSLNDLMELVKEEKFKVILDPSSPLPFTEQGGKDAFRIQASRHAHGKIVVQIASDDEMKKYSN